MCYDNEEWCRIWKGIDMSVQNWQEEFNKFWPEHSEISQICTLMGSFWPKYICSSLESTEELCLMALKVDAKFEGKLTWASKSDMKNLANFHYNSWRYQNWDFDGILLSNVENVWA